MQVQAVVSEAAEWCTDRDADCTYRYVIFTLETYCTYRYVIFTLAHIGFDAKRRSK